MLSEKLLAYTKTKTIKTNIMKTFFAIYLLGSSISFIMTLITLTLNKNKGKDIIDQANDKLSQKFDCYERINFVNANIYCIINFFMSWAQVAMFIYAYLPSKFLIKMYFYRFISLVFIWIANKTSSIAHSVIEKHNNLIKDYNIKHGIEQD
jgi:hypothetical protein